MASRIVFQQPKVAVRYVGFSRAAFALWVAVTMLLSACGSKVVGGGTDTSTDWAKACTTKTECLPELHCGCGICTRECERDSDCASLSKNATCVTTPTECGAEQSICVLDDTFSWLATSGGSTEPDGGARSSLDPDGSQARPPLDGACSGDTCAVGEGCDPRFGCGDEATLVCESGATCEDMGRCKEGPRVDCDAEFAPVCGCDGMTYANTCEVRGAGIEYVGECGAVVTQPASDCLAAIDLAVCCPYVQAVSQSEVEADVCLVEATGAVPSELWANRGDCAANDVANCSGVDCVVPSDEVVLSVSELGPAGECQLVENTCLGQPCEVGGECNPRVGCPGSASPLTCASGTCGGPGECVEEVAPVACGEISAPVCGCNGVTYDNECRAHGAAIESVGACGACLEVVNLAGCCLAVRAATAEEVAADECLVALAGRDPAVVWDNRGACNTPCPGANCIAFDADVADGAIAFQDTDGMCQIKYESDTLPDLEADDAFRCLDESGQERAGAEQSEREQTCYNSKAEAECRTQELLDTLPLLCEVDADCTELRIQPSCLDQCRSAFVAISGIDLVQEGLANIDEEVCSRHQDAMCTSLIKPCEAEPASTPACIDGQCSGRL